MATESHAVHHGPELRHHFETVEQQRESSTVGMWTFLVTEIMFFSAMFFAYALYRMLYHDAFASTSKYMDVPVGAINTAVLIGSSFTMVLAVRAAKLGQRNMIILFLIATMILGGVFLGVKAYEYHHKYVEHLIPGFDFHYPPAHAAESVPADGQYRSHAQIFFFLYFMMTGMHALHMIIGEGMLLTLVIMAYKGRFTRAYNTPVDMIGLYWHFVDIVWIFLFPLLYLIGKR